MKLLTEQQLSALPGHCPHWRSQNGHVCTAKDIRRHAAPNTSWLQSTCPDRRASCHQADQRISCTAAAAPLAAAPVAERLVVAVGSREITLETGEIGRQANGAVMIREGDTVVYTTVCCQGEPGDTDNFSPFSVAYTERFSAIGKTSGSFFRRESRANANEMIISRLTDRPLRPMLPKGWAVETQVLSWVLSYDGQHQTEPLAITSAGAALALSDIPLSKPVAGVRVGMSNNGVFVVNPTQDQQDYSPLDLVVAGTADGILMIEGCCDFLTEEQMLEALTIGFKAVSHLCYEIQAWADRIGKPKRTDLGVEDSSLDAQIAGSNYAAEIKETYRKQLGKQQRSDAISNIRARVVESLTASTSGSAEGSPEAEMQLKKRLGKALKRVESRIMRDLILDEGIRADGRGLTEVRPISARCGMLPRPHGSALFTRGETQAIAVTTLGSLEMALRPDNMADEGPRRFYLQYSFPPSSVGETGRMGPPGRREVGHGTLAERALLPIIPEEDDFPYTVRVESTITESNGSSSMASVCGGCLSLQDAGVPIKRQVAGVAMGLILGEDGRHAILTDILGSEDGLGDMDFKVAGDASGITAFQMDIKVEGISLEVMAEALAQAKLGRQHILGEMARAEPPPRATLGPYTPRVQRIQVDPSQVGIVIGAGGKSIRNIRESTGCVSIQTTNDGLDGIFEIVADTDESIAAAKRVITAMVEEPEVGRIYRDVKVVGIEKFGLFVEFLPSRPGLLHTSELANNEDLNDFDINDIIDVMLLAVDAQKFKLSRSFLNGDGPRKGDSTPIERSTFQRPAPGTICRDVEIKDVKLYGVFVEVAPGFSGLVHMSELYLENEPRKAFNTGDRISVIVLDPRDDGKQSFSRRLAYKDGRVLGDGHEASNDLAAAA